MFTILISFLNVAANGYSSKYASSDPPQVVGITLIALSVVHTTDIGLTFHEHALPSWMRRWPFKVLTKVSVRKDLLHWNDVTDWREVNASCQPNDLAVGSSNEPGFADNLTSSCQWLSLLSNEQNRLLYG